MTTLQRPYVRVLCTFEMDGHGKEIREFFVRTGNSELDAPFNTDRAKISVDGDGDVVYVHGDKAVAFRAKRFVNTSMLSNESAPASYPAWKEGTYRRIRCGNECDTGTGG